LLKELRDRYGPVLVGLRTSTTFALPMIFAPKSPPRASCSTRSPLSSRMSSTTWSRTREPW